MKLAICTDVYGDLSYTDMLDKVKSLGVDAVEMTAGGWGGRKHVNTEELLSDAAKRSAFMSELEKRGMRISALNTSCNPTWPSETGKEYARSMYDCAKLAGLLGVKKLVCMAGLPAGSPTDTTPNWITSTVSWPDFMAPTYAYQWEVTTQFFKEFASYCESVGVEQIAIEEFPGTMVWSASTLLKLREAVGPMIGINLDPSHMIILGADPIAAARALKGAIYHVHGKDARIERGLSDVDGILEPRPVTEPSERVWNYVAVGCGKDLQWWKEFFSVVHMMGYDGDVSLEMEDLTMTVEAGVLTSVNALRQTISV